MSKLLDIKTNLIKPIKTLVELLKDILVDLNLEVVRGENNNIKKIKNNNNDDDDEDQNEKEGNNDDNENENEDNDEDNNENDKEVNDEDVDVEIANEEDDNNKKDNYQNKKEMKGGCIRFTATDHTKTTIINMALFGENFNEFEVGKSVVDVGINLNQFYKIIKSIENDDMMRMYIDKDDRQNLVIETRKADGESDSSSKMKLMDINKKKLNIPPTNFDAVITIDTTQFHKKCKDIHNFAEYIDIQCTRNKLTFTCKGDAVEHSHNFYPETSSVKIKFAKNAPPVVQGIFELKYIVMFTKCSGLCDEIQIFMKNNYPLSINYTVATLGRILFCLAPVPEDVITKNFEEEDNLYEHNDVKYKNKD